MKKLMVLLAIIAASFSTIACPVCDRAKAKAAFGSFTHGVGPTSNWDYIGVWIVIIAVILSFFYSIKWLVKPKDSNPDHIRYSILNSD